MDIKRNIEEIRKKKGIKQEVLANRLGITQSTYSGYLTQNEDIRFSLILRIANALDVEVIDLLTYPDIYQMSSDCQKCREKEKTIDKLVNYIENLERIIENRYAAENDVKYKRKE